MAYFRTDLCPYSSDSYTLEEKRGHLRRHGQHLRGAARREAEGFRGAAAEGSGEALGHALPIRRGEPRMVAGRPRRQRRSGPQRPCGDLAPLSEDARIPDPRFEGMRGSSASKTATTAMALEKAARRRVHSPSRASHIPPSASKTGTKGRRRIAGSRKSTPSRSPPHTSANRARRLRQQLIHPPLHGLVVRAQALPARLAVAVVAVDDGVRQRIHVGSGAGCGRPAAQDLVHARLDGLESTPKAARRASPLPNSPPIARRASPSTSHPPPGTPPPDASPDSARFTSACTSS